MREQLQARLETLRHHVALGQVALDKVESQRTNLRAMLGRMQEAIERLEALLAVPETRTHHSGAGHRAAVVPACPLCLTPGCPLSGQQCRQAEWSKERGPHPTRTLVANAL